MPPLLLTLLTWALSLASLSLCSPPRSPPLFIPSLSLSHDPTFFSRPSASDKHTCSFLGGALMTISQQQPDPSSSRLPALFSVTAEWNVAWLRAEAGVDYTDPNNRHGLGQWVGVQGSGCARADWFPFLQAGTGVSMDEHGASVAAAWVEWFPASSQEIPKENMTGAPGDQMRVTVEVFSQTTGNVSITNLSQNTTYRTSVSAPNATDPSYQICLGDGNAQVFAEWAIKDDRARALVFNNVTFSRVAATARRNPFYYDFGNATAVDLWDMSAAGAHFALPERLDNSTLRVYSPAGKDWDPAAAVAA
ncbi:peptidase A4 family-domain-containing protein [Camillea tinctor]|nr:peptidase A4 family-domain-containing protein [Camillea tinctor]